VPYTDDEDLDAGLNAYVAKMKEQPYAPSTHVPAPSTVKMDNRVTAPVKMDNRVTAPVGTTDPGPEVTPIIQMDNRVKAPPGNRNGWGTVTDASGTRTVPPQGDYGNVVHMTPQQPAPSYVKMQSQPPEPSWMDVVRAQAALSADHMRRKYNEIARTNPSLAARAIATDQAQREQSARQAQAQAQALMRPVVAHSMLAGSNAAVAPQIRELRDQRMTRAQPMTAQMTPDQSTPNTGE
jgi:hypothetical protein